jgi:hypothetical protein
MAMSIKAIAAVLALGALGVAGSLGVALAEADPCAKESAAASRRNAPPRTIKDLQSCRSKQRGGSAPWKRDGGTTDEQEYVQVPCPPGLPPWRVCEKKRSEMGATPDGGSPHTAR